MEHFRSPEAETDPGDAESGNVFLFITRFFYHCFFLFFFFLYAPRLWAAGDLECSVGNFQGITVVW